MSPRDPLFTAQALGESWVGGVRTRLIPIGFFCLADRTCDQLGASPTCCPGWACLERIPQPFDLIHVTFGMSWLQD